MVVTTTTTTTTEKGKKPVLPQPTKKIGSSLMNMLIVSFVIDGGLLYLGMLVSSERVHNLPPLRYVLLRGSSCRVHAYSVYL